MRHMNAMKSHWNLYPTPREQCLIPHMDYMQEVTHSCQAMRRECRERTRSCGLFVSWLRLWHGVAKQDKTIKFSWEGNWHLHQAWSWDPGEYFYVQRNELSGSGTGMHGSGANTEFSLFWLYLQFKEAPADNQFVGHSDFKCHLWGCLSSTDLGTYCMPSFLFVGHGYGASDWDFKLFPSRILLLMFNESNTISGVLFQYCQFRISWCVSLIRKYASYGGVTHGGGAGCIPRHRGHAQRGRVPNHV